jgi:hypothetical protein
MIQIDKGQVGFFDVAIFDKYSTFVSNQFDFEFENEVTGEVVQLTLTDTSTSFSRYSRFFYTINDFANNTSGFYRYKIIHDNVEIAQGRMYLYVNPQVTQSYDGYDKTTYVYDK